MNPSGRKDFFISYARRDVNWAEWIAWTLQAAGFGVIFDRWNFHAGQNFVQKMNEALAQAERLVLVWLPSYFESRFGAAEWMAAFVEDARDESGKLVPVVVLDHRSPGDEVWCIG